MKKEDSELLPLVNFFAETLRETLEEWAVSQAEVARQTGIPSPHLTDMKKGRRRCTPEHDLRLSRYFGTSQGFWLRLQLDYEMMRAAREKGALIAREAHPYAVSEKPCRDFAGGYALREPPSNLPRQGFTATSPPGPPATSLGRRRHH